jgi:hypothetical protein
VERTVGRTVGSMVGNKVGSMVGRMVGRMVVVAQNKGGRMEVSRLTRYSPIVET